MENNNIVKPVSCKNFFPSEVQKHFPPFPHGENELACFLHCFSDPQAPVQTASVDFFQRGEVEICTLSEAGALFPLAPLCSASKMVGKLSFRRAEERLCGVMSSRCLQWCCRRLLPLPVQAGSPAFLAGEYIQGFPLNDHRPWEHVLVSKIKI